MASSYLSSLLCSLHFGYSSFHPLVLSPLSLARHFSIQAEKGKKNPTVDWFIGLLLLVLLPIPLPPIRPPPSPTLLCGQTKTIQFLVFCLLCFAYILAPWWGIRKHDRAYKEMRMSNTISYLLWRVRPITSQWNLSPTVAKGSALNSTTDREVNRTVTFRFKFLIVDQNQKKHRLLALILTHS